MYETFCSQVAVAGILLMNESLAGDKRHRNWDKFCFFAATFDHQKDLIHQDLQP